MSNGIVKKIAGTFSLLLLLFIKGYPQDTDIDFVRLMFYNVENLFDIYDDTLTDDDEFLPGGLRRWNYKRYNTKINSLYKTIIAAGEWQPPAIIAFCEVENRKVLEDLIYKTNLSKYKYDIVHEDSPDERGIDVALIYRKEIVKLVGSSYLKTLAVTGTGFRTRDVLYTSFLINNDTVHLFVNHWPSRRGGVLAGQPQRMKIAAMVRSKIDSLNSKSHGKARIIITGDFNATPDDEVMSILTEKNEESNGSMLNLSERLPPGSGTYRYKGTWEIIDQFIVSDQLLNKRAAIFTDHDNLRIFSSGFLLKKDLNYPGLSPNSTYYGYRYQGGYSDHLPVLLDLMLR
jgi:predicted extracellular nuclease